MADPETKSAIVAGWTQEDLNPLTCAEPGCTQKHHHGPLHLSGRCHPKSAVIAKYYYGGVIEIRCKTCNKHCCNVFVAPEVAVAKDQAMIEGCPCGKPPEEHIMILRGCADHRGAGAHVTYYDGNLTIVCGDKRCTAVIDTLHVKHKAAEA